MTVSDPANEWGLPDWRDSSSYRNSFGNPSEWSFARWRWEFLRRREDYRTAFSSLVEAASNGTYFQDSFTNNGEIVQEQMVQGNLIAAADQRGFAFPVIDNLDLLSSFGMFFFPNPRFSEQPEPALLLSEPYIASKFDVDGKPLGVLTYHFDLMRPIAKQLEACEAKLKEIKAKIPGAVWEEKHHVQNWHEYLRALDARESNVSYARMLGPAFPKRRTRDAIKALVNQAIGVRESF